MWEAGAWERRPVARQAWALCALGHRELLARAHRQGCVSTSDPSRGHSAESLSVCYFNSLSIRVAKYFFTCPSIFTFL